MIVTRPQTPQARQALQVVRAPQPLPTALILKNHPHLHPRKENKNPKRRIINLKSHQIVTLKIYILHCFDPSIRLLYIALHYQECIECYNNIWAINLLRLDDSSLILNVEHGKSLARISCRFKSIICSI